MNVPKIHIHIKTPDARGWIGFGCYSLTVLVFAMILIDKGLLKEDAFLILATAIVITGWNGGPVGWAYQATKGGGEQAESSARIAESVAGLPPITPISEPLPVKVENSEEEAVPVRAGDAT